MAKIRNQIIFNKKIKGRIWCSLKFMDQLDYSEEVQGPIYYYLKNQRINLVQMKD
jgi:hypothetical protein